MLNKPDSEMFEYHSGMQEMYGTYTRDTLSGYRRSEVPTAKEALLALQGDLEPFAERLVRYVAKKVGIESDFDAVRAFLREKSDEKGLDLSRQLLNSWFKADARREVTVIPENIFKLSLAMELNWESCDEFAYNCLYQDRLNCRDAEQAAYLFFLSCQSLFGNKTFATCESFLKNWDGKGSLLIGSGTDFGQTRILEESLRGRCIAVPQNQQEALDSIRNYFDENAELFDSVRHSTIRVYRDYLANEDKNFTSLKELYRDATGRELPEKSYLDMSKVLSDLREKGYAPNDRDEWYRIQDDGEVDVFDLRKGKLLWGSLYRGTFVEKNGKDYDLLSEHEVKTERHAVGKMVTNGVPRGNILLVLLFRFSYEFEGNNGQDGWEHPFERFWKQANRVLVDECGLTPLHPRKPFDRLILTSIWLGTNKAYRNPTEALNLLLKDYYDD